MSKINCVAGRDYTVDDDCSDADECCNYGDHQYPIPIPINSQHIKFTIPTTAKVF